MERKRTHNLLKLKVNLDHLIPSMEMDLVTIQMMTITMTMMMIMIIPKWNRRVVGGQSRVAIGMLATTWMRNQDPVTMILRTRHLVMQWKGKP